MYVLAFIIETFCFLPYIYVHLKYELTAFVSFEKTGGFLFNSIFSNIFSLEFSEILTINFVNYNKAIIRKERIEKGQLLTSASEMCLLFCHFSYLVADLVEPDLPEWGVYLTLREIIAIVLQKTIHKDTHILLQTLIKEHHELFQSVFKTELSPKMHFMVHYPRIMRSIGPLCYVSSMRYESFHKIFKNIIKNNNCRKNITASCAFKIKMRYADLFLNFETLSYDVVTAKKKNSLNKTVERISLFYTAE